MFEGYLLKINGDVFPNKFIDIKTYKAVPNKKRVLYSYYDGNDVLKEVLSPHTTTSIEFTTNGVFSAGKQHIMSFLPTKTNIYIEYWNDITETYESGYFKCNDFVFSIYKIRGNERIYQPVSFAFEEY